MSEVCPKSGRPCPIDRNFNRIENTFEPYPDMKNFVSRVRNAAEARRSQAGCEGEFTDQQDIQHCTSEAASQIQEIVTIRGGLLGFDPATFKDITRSKIG